MIIEWTSILFVIFLLTIALFVIKLIENKMNISPETKRKMLHGTMGIVMLTFPYIFKSNFSVGLLAIIAISILVILKKTKLKESLGTVLYSVNRESLGEIFFVISVFLIFYLSKGDKILFSIPILILTFADSTAALVGKKYGKKNVAELNEDAKSIEGSFMFFMVAFMATLVPLLLWTNVGREETLIISTIIGFNVALIEMICHTGNDNLFIPLTTYAFLTTHINLTVESLRMNLIILVGIFLVVSIVNRVKSWSKLALVETMVIGYLTINLYGIYALIPPLMLFFSTMRFPKIREIEKSNLYDARIIETNILVGIAICGFVAITGLKNEFFMIYSLAYSMHLAINTFVRLKYYFNLSEKDSLILSFSKGLFFIFLPCIIIQKIVFNTLPSGTMIIIEIALLLTSCLMILLKKKNITKEEITIKNGYIHMKIVVLLIALISVFQFVLSNFYHIKTNM